MKKTALVLLLVCVCVLSLSLKNAFAEYDHPTMPFTYNGLTYDMYFVYSNNADNTSRTTFMFYGVTDLVITNTSNPGETNYAFSYQRALYSPNANFTSMYGYYEWGAYTGGGNQFTAYLSSNVATGYVATNFSGISTEPFLGFPLANYTPYTASISSVFDHSGTAQYSDSDQQVIDFSGESSDVQTPYTGSTCYPKSDNSTFGSGFNYVGTSGTGGSYYLCYNGHPGIDYPIANNTTVYAAADGIAHIPSSFPGVSSAQTYNTVEIDHQNGYKTYYLHLSSQNVTENQQVYKGQTIIGYSGDTGASGAYHLHFELQKNGIPVDPYGWTGSGTDPYTRAININLWQ